MDIPLTVAERKSLAQKMFDALNAMDGNTQDNMIKNTSADGSRTNIWNGFAAYANGRSINCCIIKDKALKSISYYLSKNGADIEGMMAYCGLSIDHSQNAQKSSDEKPSAQKTSNNSSIPQTTVTESAKAEKTQSTDNNSIDKTGVENVKTVKEKSSTDNITYDEKISGDLFNKAVDSLIKKKKGQNTNSKLLGLGKTFFDIAVSKGLDPFVLIAVSILESGWGLKLANKNNFSGNNGPNGYRKYDTPEGCIKDSADCLKRNADRHGSLRNIAMKGNYCCARSEGRNRWGNSINSIANNLRREYNSLIA